MISILLVSNVCFSCEEWLYDYINDEIQSTEAELDEMIFDESENFMYFFYQSGRVHALEDVKDQLELRCKADLH